MKSSISLTWALAIHHVAAFPSMLSDAMIKIRTENEAKGFDAERTVKRQLPGAVPPFDADVQYVSNKGAHAFVAPSGDDQRGPCPGLNAMANHGYLPHNGIGSMSDFIQGTQDAFGMGADIATFLAVYGAVFDGNLESYSIGGPYPSLTNGLLLGEPQGLSGSHNKYEGDNSPTRGDLYQRGNAYLLQMDYFKELYELGQENGDSIDLDILTEYRYKRFQESIATNPYFFNAPFSGVVASPAAWSFIYRFMANKSEEHPEGLLNGEVLKSFYSITGDYPDFEYTPGWERIPDNWYKRNPIDYYTIPYFSLDNVAMILKHPEFADVGGNTGSPNTFTGVNLADLTGGVFNAASLGKGNNAICFGLEASLNEAPDILTGLYSDVDPAVDALGTAIDKATNGLGCPQLNAIQKGQFNKYPGYTKLKDDGTY